MNLPAKQPYSRGELAGALVANAAAKPFNIALLVGTMAAGVAVGAQVDGGRHPGGPVQQGRFQGRQRVLVGVGGAGEAEEAHRWHEEGGVAGGHAAILPAIGRG